MEIHVHDWRLIDERIEGMFVKKRVTRWYCTRCRKFDIKRENV